MMSKHTDKEQLYIEKAEAYFHGKEGYNCAQAVLKAFQDDYQISEEKIREFKLYGGGRAEDGICGALYAALQLCTEEQKPALIEAFEIAAKHSTCEKIKDKTLPCNQCVAAAAQALAGL